MTNKFLKRLSYFNHDVFLKLLFVKIFVLFLITAVGQGKFLGDADDLNRKLRLKNLPTVNVWDKNGKEYELNTYISNNQLNEGKAIMLVTIAFRGYTSIKELNDIAKSSIPDEYNVVVLCAGNHEEMLGNKLTKYGSEKEWPKFLVVKILWDDLPNFYIFDGAFTVFADKGSNVLYFDNGWGRSVKQVKWILD